MTTTTREPDRKDVTIVGAGPVGLLLAAEFALAGRSVIVLEQTEQRSGNSRALGVMPRTMELLALRGALDPFLAVGRPVPRWHFGMLETNVEFARLPTPFPYMLSLPQTVTEELLERRALDLGVELRRGTTVVGVEEISDRVVVDARDSGGTATFDSALLVGCDGGRSTVRAAASIPFDGEPSTQWGFLGDVELDDPPAPGFRVRRPDGALIVAPLPGGVFRVTGWDPGNQHPNDRFTFRDLRAITEKLAGSDLGMHDPRWISRFGNANRLARTYRKGRTLLAGDAAHVHWPAGGLGLNAGLQDAMNLGWRAAAYLGGAAPESTLDLYGCERRGYGEALQSAVLAQSLLITARSPEELAIRDLMNRMMATADGNRLAADFSAGLGFRYPAADDDPLVGARYALDASDADVLPLFHSGRPVVLTTRPETLGFGLDAPPASPLSVVLGHLPEGFARRHRVDVVLLRPDGYVAWTSSGGAAAPDPDLVRRALHAPRELSTPFSETHTLARA